MRTRTTLHSPALRPKAGSTLIAALLVLTILSVVAATVFRTAVPAYRGTYHGAAWHESRLAGDAGVDVALAAIQSSLPNTNVYTWPGWTDQSGNPVVPGTDGVRVLTPSSTLLAHAGDGNAKPRVLRVEVDVITRDDNVAKNPWYRIRSTGLAEVPSSQLGLDKRDDFLRRMSLRKRYVTRTIEVETRPLYLWEYALKTSGLVAWNGAPAMILGGGTDWIIDSYDHRYPGVTSGPDGMYTLATSRAFGNVATNQQRPAGSPYGPLIDAAGANIRGEVQTRGGDNPDTVVHENVEESDRIDQTRITSEFEETLNNATAPSWTSSPSQYVLNPAVIDGTGSTITNPKKIVLKPNGNQSQGGFTIKTPTTTAPQYVDIYVNADLILSGSSIVVPPNVYAQVWINGNIDYKNQDINYSAASSRVPGNLLMYGVSTNPAARVDSSGNGHIVAAFYGPQYAGHLDGNTEIIGGFVLKTYDTAGGGGSGGDSVGAGFHYDEALGVVGPIQQYKAVSYFEDFRRDLD
jgi:hypothetical protein